MLYATLETRKNKSFGTSLLLANRPMSPKIINGSFAAIFDNNDVLFEFAKKLSQFRYGENDCPGQYHNVYFLNGLSNVYLKLKYSYSAPYSWNAYERKAIVP